MKTVVRAMMSLIACEVCGKELGTQTFSLSDEELSRLYKLSKAHDCAHLAGDALIKNNLIQNAEIKAKFEKQRMLAVYRYERINYELCRLRDALNGAKIPFILLKWAVLRAGTIPSRGCGQAATSIFWCEIAILSTQCKCFQTICHINKCQKALMMSECFLKAAFIWSYITA